MPKCTSALGMGFQPTKDIILMDTIIRTPRIIGTALITIISHTTVATTISLIGTVATVTTATTTIIIITINLRLSDL